jgi:hypothetical protein
MSDMDADTAATAFAAKVWEIARKEAHRNAKSGGQSQEN